MATWLYQINQQQWPPEKYRTDIWEGEEETWPVGRLVRGDSEEPQPGDVVVFFYAPTGGWDWGFYGWAVIVGWHSRDEDKEIRFRPTSPSDRLKMDPCVTAKPKRWQTRFGDGSSRAPCGRCRTTWSPGFAVVW
jgi:hypothetical protein